MQYLLMIHDDERVLSAMNARDREQFMGEYRTFTQEVIKSGHFRAGAQLQPIGTATTLRRKDGKVSPTDGPYAETKEQLGGYYLVECKDLDEALALAGRIPSLRIGGAIEVRPLVPMTEPTTRTPSAP